MISVEIEYQNESKVTIYQEGGIHWAGGSVIDTLVKHFNGSSVIKNISINPEADMPRS